MALRQQQDRMDVLQGTLDMLILQTLQWGPQHGLRIAQGIRLKSEELLRVEAGIALSGAPPAGTARLAEIGMEGLRQRAAREVLPPHSIREETARSRAGQMGAIRQGHRPRDAAD